MGLRLLGVVCTMLTVAAVGPAQAQGPTSNPPPWTKPAELPATSAAKRFLADPSFEQAWRGQVRGQLTQWDNNFVTPSCPTSEIAKAVTTESLEAVVETPQSIIMRASTTLCTELRTINFIIVREANGMGIHALLPGHTTADPVLARDALTHVQLLLTPALKARIQACADHPNAQAQMIDVQPMDRSDNPGAGLKSWKERWIYRACGTDFPTVVTFVQEVGKPGTTIGVGPN